LTSTWISLVRPDVLLEDIQQKHLPLLLIQVLFPARVSKQLAFLIAALNGIDIMSCDLEKSCDLENAYLNVQCCEKFWFVGGLECDEDKGKALIVVRGLYGLKSAGAY
jgi:hypothetical protein